MPRVLRKMAEQQAFSTLFNKAVNGKGQKQIMFLSLLPLETPDHGTAGHSPLQKPFTYIAAITL